MNFAAGADWQCLQKWSVDVIAAPLLWKALDFICVPFGQFSGSNQKRGIDTIAAPRGFPTLPKRIVRGQASRERVCH